MSDVRLSCINLVHAYNNDIDTGHAERVPELFTDDAVLEVGGRALTGVDAIRAAMQARAANTERKTTHVSSNVQFTNIDEHTAAATSVVLLFVLDDGPPTPNAIVRCNDEFVRVDDGEWRFRRRSLSVVAGKA